jgi:hypothetical protein
MAGGLLSPAGGAFLENGTTPRCAEVKKDWVLPCGGASLAGAMLSRCADGSARVEDDDGGRALVIFDEGGAGVCTAKLEERMFRSSRTWLTLRRVSVLCCLSS